MLPPLLYYTVPTLQCYCCLLMMFNFHKHPYYILSVEHRCVESIPPERTRVNNRLLSLACTELWVRKTIPPLSHYIYIYIYFFLKQHLLPSLGILICTLPSINTCVCVAVRGLSHMATCRVRCDCSKLMGLNKVSVNFYLFCEMRAHTIHALVYRTYSRLRTLQSEVKEI